MKTFALSFLVVVLATSTTVTQVRETKAPIEAGVGCLDVTKKLNSSITDGKMVVARCCAGLTLIADAKEETVEGTKKTTILKWHVKNSEGRELEGEIGTVNRRGMKDGKERQQFNFIEKLVVVKSPKACFVIERKTL